LLGQKGEHLTFVSLLSGDAGSSLSSSPCFVFEKWAPCALEEAKESLGESLPSGSGMIGIHRDCGMADEGDDHRNVNEAKIRDEVQ
jgi:hypothetical protein